MIKKIILFSLFFLPITVSAQFYESGQDPGYLQWRQINTDRFKLIYPETFSAAAQQFARYLTHVMDSVPGSLHHEPHKIPIVFHAYSNESNGFVVWAPRRMELYALPPQDNYGQDWLEQLALHEYRHVVQLDELNQGFTHWAGFLGGEQVTGMVSGLLPKWFLEGDAVTSETAFSSAGRGRMPSFDMELRTLWLTQKEPYSFEKIVRGSYRDYVPDHYQSGYKMTNWLRDTYGQNIFDKAIQNTARMPFTLYPFYNSLKEQTGLRKKQFYLHTFQSLQMEWASQAPVNKEPAETIQISNNHKKVYTNYRFAQFLDDSSIVAEKSGLDIPTQLVILRRGKKEKLICRTGNTEMVNLSAASGILVWAEKIPDPRWQNGGKTILRYWDIQDQKVQTIARGKNILSPSLSPNGQKIVLVENSADYSNSLVVLAIDKPKETVKISLPQNAFVQQPRWMDTTSVVMIWQDEQGKSIKLLNLNTLEWTELLAPTFDELSDISCNSPWITFRAGFTGLSQIYAINSQTKKCWQVTSDPYGASYPAIDSDNKYLMYSSYTAMGFDLKQTPVDTSQWIPCSEINKTKVNLYQRVSAAEGHALKMPPDNGQVLKEEPYRKISHLFRLHSWLPLYTDYSNLQISDPSFYPGFTLLSQNSLGTAISSLAYARKDGYNYFETRFSYKGFYPVVELSHTYGGINYSYPYDTIVGYTLNHQEFKIRSYVPLNFSSGPWIRIMAPYIMLTQRSDRFRYNNAESYKPGIAYFQYRLLAYQYLRMSARDITPCFGQILDLNFEHTPLENQLLGSIGSARLGLYFPGPLKHQSFFLAGTYQKQMTGNNRYFFGSFVSLPRGYSNHTSITLEKLSLDYYFPLLYPDINIGTLFYLKRIRGSLFTEFAWAEGVLDYTEGTWKMRDQSFFSNGGELLADFHLFQLVFPITAGVQIIYIPVQKQYSISPVMRINLTAF